MCNTPDWYLIRFDPAPVTKKPGIASELYVGLIAGLSRDEGWSGSPPRTCLWDPEGVREGVIRVRNRLINIRTGRQPGTSFLLNLAIYTPLTPYVGDRMGKYCTWNESQKRIRPSKNSGFTRATPAGKNHLSPSDPPHALLKKR